MGCGPHTPALFVGLVLPLAWDASLWFPKPILSSCSMHPMRDAWLKHRPSAEPPCTRRGGQLCLRLSHPSGSAEGASTAACVPVSTGLGVLEEPCHVGTGSPSPEPGPGLVRSGRTKPEGQRSAALTTGCAPRFSSPTGAPVGKESNVHETHIVGDTITREN